MLLNRLTILSLLTLLPFLTTVAQVSQTERFEKLMKFSDDIFTIIPLKNEGLLLVRDKNDYDGGKRLWEIILLDKDLKERKTLEVPITTRNEFIGYEYSLGHAYLLFRSESDKSDLDLVEINLDTFEQEKFTIKPELSIVLSHFNIVGNLILLGGYVNREPAILLFNHHTNSLKVLPGLFQKDTELLDLRTNLNNTFNVVLLERNAKNLKQLRFTTYDENGNLLLQDELTVNEDVTLQTGITSILKREDLILLGTWGEGHSKTSKGFYAIPINPFKDHGIALTTFGELDSFLDYVRPNREERIQSKTIEEVKSGDIPSFTSYVHPYRLDETENGFLLIAEVYNPSSSNNYRSPYYSPYYYGSTYGYPYSGRYSRPYQYDNFRSQQDEIRNYESVLIAFDSKGKVLWDASIDLNEMKQKALEQVSEFHYRDNVAYFFYKEDSELKIKRINTRTKESSTSTQDIKLRDDGDEIRSERDQEGKVKFWFDNNYYVWGLHTIKNSSMENRVREVFYINKITVQ